MESMDENLFCLSQEYDAMLDRGIRISGEDKRYFIVGRVQDLVNQLPTEFTPERILDLGCGIGDTTAFLAETFPLAEVVGTDTAKEALVFAEERYASSRVSFCSVQTFSEKGPFNLCYVNGVFHHIHPQERLGVVRSIYEAMSSKSFFALFENNPWNVGTRIVMHRIPFDRDAQTLTPPATRRLLQQGGFRCTATRFLFYFPRPLARLRFLESHLACLPMGAQYYVLAAKE